MTRFRLVLLLFALGLSLPSGLLVRRTLTSAELEQTVRHRAVADRTYDELERMLSRFLAEEEARAFEAYRFYESLANDPGEAAAIRSPLSYPPVASFVVGYFEIDPLGEVHSPLVPEDGQPSPAGWRLDPNQRRAITRLHSILDQATAEWERAADHRRSAQEDDPPQPAAAERPSNALEGIASERLNAKKEASDFVAHAPKKALSPPPVPLEEEERSETDDAYDLLGKLNRALADRVERKQKTQYADVESFPDQAQAVPSQQRVDENKALMSDEAAEVSSELQAKDRDFASADGSGAQSLGFSRQRVRSELAEPAPAEAIAPQSAVVEKERVRVTLDPMTSRASNSDYLILYRTVLVGERGYRQGVVLERTALADWLRDRVIRASRLSHVLSLELANSYGRSAHDDLADGRTADGTYRFDHRFGEPFDSLRGELALAPLSGSGNTETVYLLVALLALAGGLGLFALDRMAAVTLDFAQRRSNFVASVSHELRTPLTSIRMYSEMLRDQLVPTEAKKTEYYATMASEAERLSRLVENVLEFSRLENGKRELAWQVGDPTELLRGTVASLAPHAQDSGLRLVFEADDDCPSVRYDRDAIVQMVFNLVDNAIKYAKKATVPEIRVHYHKKGAGTELSVRDFGPGVSKRHLRRIFEPFYRAQDELTREAKGTGIGLALVRELAQSMGAVVDAESPSDGGFRIAITLCASADA